MLNQLSFQQQELTARLRAESRSDVTASAERKALENEVRMLVKSEMDFLTNQIISLENECQKRSMELGDAHEEIKVIYLHLENKDSQLKQFHSQLTQVYIYIYIQVCL